jgi:hypothetical protein
MSPEFFADGPDVEGTVSVPLAMFCLLSGSHWDGPYVDMNKEFLYVMFWRAVA